MPGIRSLNDREFIRAFQVMDRIIQDNQPLFMLVWVGSVVALVTSAVLGIGQSDGAGRLLIIFAALAYLFGVQLPTVTINVPLNNKLHTLDVDCMRVQRVHDKEPAVRADGDAVPSLRKTDPSPDSAAQNAGKIPCCKSAAIRSSFAAMPRAQRVQTPPRDEDIVTIL